MLLRKAINARVAKLATTAMLIICVLWIPIIVVNLHLQVPQVTLRDEALEKMIELIPSNASVLTQNNIFPHLSQRMYGYVAYSGNNSKLYSSVSFDYIIVDTRSFWYNSSDLKEFIPNVTRNGEYGVLSAIDNMWLLKRGYKGEPTFPFKYGILAKFYNQGDTVPVFTSVFLDTEWDWQKSVLFPTINNNSFTISFSGYLKTPNAGNYTFRISPLNGSKLYIDGNNCSNTTTILLSKGFHKIEIEYVKSESNASVNVEWKPPGREVFETIPTANLYWNESNV